MRRARREQVGPFTLHTQHNRPIGLPCRCTSRVGRAVDAMTPVRLSVKALGVTAALLVMTARCAAGPAGIGASPATYPSPGSVWTGRISRPTVRTPTRRCSHPDRSWIGPSRCRLPSASRRWWRPSLVGHAPSDAVVHSQFSSPQPGGVIRTRGRRQADVPDPGRGAHRERSPVRVIVMPDRKMQVKALALLDKAYG